MPARIRMRYVLMLMCLATAGCMAEDPRVSQDGVQPPDRTAATAVPALRGEWTAAPPLRGSGPDVASSPMPLSPPLGLRPSETATMASPAMRRAVNEAPVHRPVSAPPKPSGIAPAPGSDAPWKIVPPATTAALAPDISPAWPSPDSGKWIATPAAGAAAPERP